MDPNPLAVLTAARHALRHMKQEIVKAEGIGTDIPLSVVTLRGPLPIGIYEILGSNEEASATVYAAVTMSDCDTVLYVGEVYVEPNCETRPAPGELPARFAAGDPRVKEAIAMTGVHRSGLSHSAFDAYHYDGRTVVWEPTIETTPLWMWEREQRLHKAMLGAFEEQARRPGKAILQPGAHLHHLGSQRLDDRDMLVSFAVCAPCPCGSGRPMNQCCHSRN